MNKTPQEIMAELREANRKREEEKRQRAEEASNIHWNDQGKAILDLLSTLFLVSGDTQDTRFSNWAKEVTGINPKLPGGYALEGDFVPRGTIEIERKYRVYLVASSSGSRKHTTVDYRVIVMNDEGKLVRTDIATDDSTPGWALRIRDRISDLLKGK